jgi:hypothetical protein
MWISVLDAIELRGMHLVATGEARLVGRRDVEASCKSIDEVETDRRTMRRSLAISAALLRKMVVEAIESIAGQRPAQRS